MLAHNDSKDHLTSVLAQARFLGRSTRSWCAKYSGSWAAFLLVAASSALVACIPARSKASVIGVYELKVERQKLTLELASDGSFTETIQFASGQVEKRVGQWNWMPGRVGLTGLWIPREFAPDYIHRADSEVGSGQPKYTEPGYWSVSAENHWGTTLLSVFPDDDVNFRMVKRLHR